ncbi:MAG: creatininase family protein, partial [Gemmatimonadales bacterium]|nr:creatininase family protein [Gemmatimonadales bacterium]
FCRLLLPALLVPLPAIGHGQVPDPDPDMARPIDAHDSVFLEELTWLEVRDAIGGGKTTAIIATGGVEQNGPYLVTGKHNYILRATTEEIARRLGNALIAPIVPFVPEGQIAPPTGHMRYPGTISVREETFEALLSDIASSLRAHGFRRILLLGDSRGNQAGMERVAAALAEQWAGDAVTISYVPQYYDAWAWPTGPLVVLNRHEIREVPEGLHDSYVISAVLMTVDPQLLRMEQRLARGLFSINGVPLAPADRTIAIGRELVDHVAAVTVAAIEDLEGRNR